MGQLGRRIERLEGNRGPDVERNIIFMRSDGKREGLPDCALIIGAGMFHQDTDETIDAFVARMEREKLRARHIDDMTDDELEEALEVLNQQILIALMAEGYSREEAEHIRADEKKQRGLLNEN